MTDRFLVMGDNHGDTESLQRVLAEIQNESFDFAIHVGDLTNAWRTSRQHDDEHRGKERGIEQLREVEPVLEKIDARTEHGLLWVWGNQDYFGEIDYELDIGTEIPIDGCVEVAGQRFTNSLNHIEPDVILVTHMEYWRLADHFEGLAHFCGNSHRGRHKNRRLNSAYLQFRDPKTGRKRFGGYFVAEVGAASGLDVELRSIGELTRVECDRHAERGVQFQPKSRGCMFCTEDGTVMKEMGASAFYGLTHDTERETVSDEELIDYAEDLWHDPPEGFREEFQSYLAELEDHRYAPLTRSKDGALWLAEKSYSY